MKTIVFSTKDKQVVLDGVLGTARAPPPDGVLVFLWLQKPSFPCFWLPTEAMNEASLRALEGHCVSSKKKPV